MNNLSSDGSHHSDARRTNLLRTMLVATALALCLPASGFAETVDELVAKNTAARGGAAAWQAVSSLQLSGRMDVGKGMSVPYVLEQKRPDKMRLEFVFDGADRRADLRRQGGLEARAVPRAHHRRADD